jgi:hypothetical protein
MPRAFDLDLERRWRERLRDFERSGLSVREFCHSEGVEEYTFFWWRRELAKRNRLRQTARITRLRARRHPAKRPVNHRHRAHDKPNSRAELTRRASAFVPVQVISEAPGVGCMEFRFGAWLVRVPTTIDERALRQAIRVLREEAPGC